MLVSAKPREHLVHGVPPGADGAHHVLGRGGRARSPNITTDCVKLTPAPGQPTSPLKKSGEERIVYKAVALTRMVEPPR